MTHAERERIRQLYREGVRITEIVKRTGRCESVVQRAVRGMKRPRPAPKPSAKVARRNRLILQRVVEDGIPQAVVARRFRLSPTMVCQIVREALGLRRSSRKEPKMPKRARSGPNPQKPRPTTPWSELTRGQFTARERYIEERVSKGASLGAVARRYGITAAAVARIVDRVRARRTKP